jgi:hypothetical protein
MSHKAPVSPPGFDELSRKEHANAELWDHLTADTDKVPVLDWHLEVLDDLLAKYDDGEGGLKTDGWKTWEEVSEELGKH